MPSRRPGRNRRERETTMTVRDGDVTAPEGARGKRLADAAEGRVRLDDVNRAMLNILDDAYDEKLRIEANQKVLLNMLDDLDAKRATLSRLNLRLAQEIEEHRRTEQALRQMTAELARSNAELEQFAYVASHDLSEPLRAIAGPLSLLARRYRRALDDEADELIGFAVEGCERMQKMIEDLLVYSRVGRIEDHHALVDSGEVLRKVLVSLRPALQDAGAVIEVGPLPPVEAEETQLSQVFLNLVTNAVKFVAPGVEPRVAIAAEVRGDSWRFTVADNGIGIDARHRDRIFGMFKRLHPRDVYPGTGIGLALAKKIVEHHGGRIGVDDNPSGPGSLFWFTLPAAEGAET